MKVTVIRESRTVDVARNQPATPGQPPVREQTEQTADSPIQAA